ncbi:hypothetical protein ABIA33_004035 [Streptacidiphilus sp. MAP12-16]
MTAHPDRTTPSVPPTATSEPSHRKPRWRWPDPASPFGSVASAFLGSVAFWVLVDVLPRHIHVYWR